jgi:hypothetical protein
MPDPELTWTETRPGLWRSTDGRYAIVRAELPEPLACRKTTYTLRKIGPASARACPGTVGCFRAERYSLEEAQSAAAADAYCDDHAAERSVPEDYPALALARFFWPISEGITKAGLAICRDGDRIVARVVGMARGEDAFEPVTYAEISIAGAVLLALQRSLSPQAR